MNIVANIHVHSCIQQSGPKTLKMFLCPRSGHKYTENRHCMENMFWETSANNVASNTHRKPMHLFEAKRAPGKERIDCRSELSHVGCRKERERPLYTTNDTLAKRRDFAKNVLAAQQPVCQADLASATWLEFIAATRA